MVKKHIRVVSCCGTNIIASIGIIFLNKYIFSHCQITTITLTAIHMIITSLGLFVCLKMNTFTQKAIPFNKVLPLSIAYCAFVVSSNLSLKYNTLGTYQLFKVLTTPAVALISWLCYEVKYSAMVILTLLPVVMGVCIHSVNDFQLTVLGTSFGTIGILSAAFYQVSVGERLKELEMSSEQLLLYQAPLSAALLIPSIISSETLPSYQTWEEQYIAIAAVVASSIVAVIVNLSIYWVIQNTSALTYNMISHLKTISVLLGGFLVFNETLNFEQFLAILLTLVGLFGYTFVRMSEQNQLPCKQLNADPAPRPVIEI